MILVSNNSKKCMICHYWFFNHGFKFQDSVCNGCHDLTMLSVNIRDIAIIPVKNVNYCCIIHSISKSEVINLLKNSVLEDRGYIYKKILPYISVYARQFFVYCFCLVFIKWLVVWTCIILLILILEQ